MDPLPAWARRKILDGFARQWARARVKAGGFPLKDKGLVQQAQKLLAQGKIRELAHHDLASVTEQLVILRMNQLPKADDVWRSFHEQAKEWNVPLETLAPASTYAQFAAAEEHLHAEEYSEARRLARTAPGACHIIGSGSMPPAWPQALHIEALVTFASGDPRRAMHRLGSAISGLRNAPHEAAIHYLEALEALQSRVRMAESRETAPSDSAGREVGVLLLAIGGPSSRHTGYWRFDGRRSKIDLNDLQVRTAKAFLPYLRKARSSKKDQVVMSAELEEPILAGLEHSRTKSTLRSARSQTRKALADAVGAEIVRHASGTKGGILFLAAPLLEKGVRAVRQLKL